MNTPGNADWMPDFEDPEKPLAIGKLMPIGCDGLFSVFVTAKLKGEIYPLQGWLISESPLRIKCSNGAEYECEWMPTVVINPPERTAASMICVCENPGPHMKPGASGKFCAVCGWDIPLNTPDQPR